MDFKDDFRDKVVIVTGASGGLGKETAIQFAKAGAKVVIGDLKTDLGEQTAELIQQQYGVDARFIRLDVTDFASVESLIQKTNEAFGKIDILVNSAGIAGKGFKPFYTVEMSEWDNTYAVNVKGTVNCCKAVSKTFKAQKSGKIINIASIAGRKPTPGLMHYAASKAAVINLSQSMAAEMAKFNVNVNVVCPGWIWTPIYNEDDSIKLLADKLGKTPREFFQGMVDQFCAIKREQTEADIAYAVLFLSSEAAKNITGQSLNIDGGAVMS